MPRNDPTETGGLFIGRRPGTGPVRQRAAPRRRGAGPALAVALLEGIVALSAWGAQPVGWLWVGSRADYATGSVFLGISVALLGLIASLIVTLVLASRLDELWRHLRRAAGHDQREGLLGRIFAVTATVAGIAFAVWFLGLEGPGPTLAPR